MLSSGAFRTRHRPVSAPQVDPAGVILTSNADEMTVRDIGYHPLSVLGAFATTDANQVPSNGREAR